MNGNLLIIHKFNELLIFVTLIAVDFFGKASKTFIDNV